MRRGVVWVSIAQGSVILAQFASGAVTARVFAPEVFGGFAAALSLQAIYMMATTTGVPSYVLMRPTLSSVDKARVRIVTASLAAVAAVAFFLTLPLWLKLLQAPEGIEFRGMLAVTQLLAPTAALELALLRRGRAAGWDAAILALSGVAGLAVATAVAFATRWSGALALAPLVTAAVTIPVAIGAQRRQPTADQGELSHDTARSMSRYLAKVSSLNALHFTITQIPTWVLARAFGASTLGNYSRATSLTSTAATGVSTSVVRVIQPYWRDVAPGPALERALREAVRATAGVAFAMFAILAVVAQDFVSVWLGPGWETAGQMASILAIGAGAQVPFAMLSNAYEMRQNLRPIRGAQIATLGVLGVAAGLAVAGAEPLAVVACCALGSVAGLTYLIVAPRDSNIGSNLRLRDLGEAVRWALLLGTATAVGVVASHLAGWSLVGSEHLAALTCGSISLLPALWFAWRNHPSFELFTGRPRRTPPPTPSR